MSEDNDGGMARSRGLITFTERDRIAGKDDVEDAKRYQAVSRVRRRINEELPKECKLLEQHNPELRDELHVVASKSPRLSQGVPAYVFVKEHSETGEREIVYNGTRIQRLDYDESGDEARIAWGHNGAGTHNAVYTVLKHASNEMEIEIGALSGADRNKFRRKYFQDAKESHWAIPASEVLIWIQQNLLGNDKRNSN